MKSILKNQEKTPAHPEKKFTPFKNTPPPTSSDLKLEEIINFTELQKIMNDFYAITHFGVGIIDMEGKVLVSNGWQNVCTKFHRVHPKTNENCIESDIQLTTGLKPGEIRNYKCKNNFREVSTPIIINGKQYGNIFLGQFFYDDEKPDYDFFRRQAKKYGFDVQEYINAVKQVPRWSRTDIDNVMKLYSKLALVISELSFNNLNLAQSLEKIQKTQDIITAKNKELNLAQRIASIGNWSLDPTVGVPVWSDEIFKIYERDPKLGPHSLADYKRIYSGQWFKKFQQAITGAIQQGIPYDIQLKLELPSGNLKWVRTICEPEWIKESEKYFLRGTIQDITKTKEVEEELNAIMEMSPAMIAVLDQANSHFKTVNPAFKKILGYEQSEFLDKSIYDYIHPKDKKNIKTQIEQSVTNNVNLINIETRYRSKNGPYKWLNWLIKPYTDMGLTYAVAMNITENKKALEDLEKIKWMLSPSDLKTHQIVNAIPIYGDLSELATNREIQDAVGKETLKKLVTDFLSMLETSSAVYEKNGDYALGIMSSEWCSTLDDASRKLCKTDDNAEALKSGQWLCHESCWNSASKRAMNKQTPIDMKCVGGIRLYAVPIFAADDVVGAINFGYGSPPREESKLKSIARHYDLPLETLKQKAREYQVRPPFLIEIAKKRLETTAMIIGEAVLKKRIEKALKESEKRYRTLIMQSADCLIFHDLKGNILDVNEKAIQTYEYSREELQSMNVSLLDPDYDERANDGSFFQALLPGQPISFEARQISKSGREFPVEVRLSLVDIDGKKFIQGLCRDISEKREAEKEQRKLQQQLQQAIKMESVGRLAGGVAHDFNNMLNVILGYSDMALRTLSQQDRFYEDFTEIRDAAKRSADLTKQLLAFARKQTVSPQILDINQTIGNILKMLKRLIGENIELTWQPGKNIGYIYIDPAQIDQILTNLVVNARDAIPETGQIIIETNEEALNESYCKHHLGFIPGNYTTLSVSDNGKGMNKETKAHIFEPFYTTKPTGQGTGLGLSTVYGIAKQNKGFVNVYSEPGEGTIIKIFLPQHQQEVQKRQTNRFSEKLTSENETILVVEDEEAILNLATKMLKSLGYKVLSASRPSEAISIAEEHIETIDLLITDVIMPEMNGRDLASRLLSLYPDIKLIFMSGYTANIIDYDGKIENKMHFIQKPFSIRQISEKLREVLVN